jgi:hypothetical protein
VSITYQITATDVVPGPINRQVLLEAQAKGVAVMMKGHFRLRQGEGNKKGWPLPKFWFGVKNTMASATGVAEVTEQQAIVTVADARMNQKVFGGTIRPKRAKTLVIPLTAAAARMASDGGSLRDEDLKLIVTKKGAFLAKESFESRGATGRRRGKQPPGIQRQRLQFLFRLVKSVTQKADPRALPTPEQFNESLRSTADKIVPRLIRRSGGPSAN